MENKIYQLYSRGSPYAELSEEIQRICNQSKCTKRGIFNVLRGTERIYHTKSDRQTDISEVTTFTGETATALHYAFETGIIRVSVRGGSTFFIDDDDLTRFLEFWRKWEEHMSEKVQLIPPRAGP